MNKKIVQNTSSYGCTGIDTRCNTFPHLFQLNILKKIRGYAIMVRKPNSI